MGQFQSNQQPIPGENRPGRGSTIAISLAFVGSIVHSGSNNAAVALPQATVSTQSANCLTGGRTGGEICPPRGNGAPWQAIGYWQLTDGVVGEWAQVGSYSCPDAAGRCSALNVIARDGCPSSIV